MMDRDIKRKSTSRIAPRSGAIVYGIEGSNVVLAALERTKVEDDIAFLKPVADNATALLCTMREIREGEVDDEFAGLALDACGLAFILINECHRFRWDHDQIPDQMKWGSNELAEYLRDDIHPFVQKKIGRGFLKRHLMHATDDEKIMKFREKLRGWMGKLGIQTNLSIHEKLEAIISERVLTRNEEAAQERIVNVVHSDPTTDLPNLTSNSEAFKEKPLPQIIVSDSRDEEGLEGQTGPTETIDNKKPVGHPSPTEDRELQEMRREEERLARKAERERWRRSEQEFSLLRLQETTAPAQPTERPSRPASVASFCSQAYSLESVRSSVADLTSISKHDEGTDHELALQLQAQLAKEIEEEDEKKALEIGIALHHQWDAEKQETSDKLHLGSNVQLCTPDSMDSRSVKPETRSTQQVNQHHHPLPGVKTTLPDANRSASPMHPQPSRAHK